MGFSRMVCLLKGNVRFIKSDTTMSFRFFFLNSDFNKFSCLSSETASSPGENNGGLGVCVMPGLFLFGDFLIEASGEEDEPRMIGERLNSLKRFINDCTIPPYKIKNTVLIYIKSMLTYGVPVG